MTTPLRRPQTTKFQLAPCQMPVANQVIRVARYTGTRLPSSGPIRARDFLEMASMGFDTDTG